MASVSVTEICRLTAVAVVPFGRRTDKITLHPKDGEAIRAARNGRTPVEGDPDIQLRHMLTATAEDTAPTS